MILSEQTEALTRSDVAPSDAFEPQPKRSKVPEIVAYHDGDDRSAIQRKMAARYATSVIRGEDSDTGEIRYHVTKTKAAQAAAIAAGLYEVVCRGTTRKITRATATLVQNSEITFQRDGAEDDEFSEMMRRERRRGGFSLAMARLDDMSVVCGSAALLVQVMGSRLSYQPLTAAQVWIVYGSDIAEGDEIRPVDRSRIDEASCVVIETAPGSFAGFWGRSDQYPRGRYARWDGESDSWKSAPAPGAAGCWDWMDADDIANPLTLWQEETGDYSIPEYPLIAWYGMTSPISEVLPVSDSLYEASLEIDLTASRISMAANKGARGAWFLTQEAGASPVQPSSFDEGVKALEPGQGAIVLTVPSSNVEVAASTNDRNARYLADEYGVPSYMISGADTTYQIPSGVALQEIQKPLQRTLESRYEANEASMERLFRVECGLIGMETGDMFGDGVEQIWTLRTALSELPILERLAEQQQRITMGLSDAAQALVDLGDYPDREAAAEYLATLTTVAPEPAPTGGLMALRRTLSRG